MFSKKNMTLIAYLFSKLQTAKHVVRQMSKKSRFSSLFNKRHATRSQTLLKSEDQHLSHIYWSQQRQLSWKKSLLVICKILGLFLNTSATDDKYFGLNRGNLMQPIQMEVSKKKKKVFWIVFYILGI